MIKRVLIFGFAAAVMFSSCGGDSSTENTDGVKSVDENTLGLIKSDVQNDDETLLGAMPEYSKAAPGTAEKMERSFENAPPLIPHSTAGLVPIKKDANMCLSCHMPAVAEAMKATPIPPTHFTDYRPKVKEKNGKYAVDAEEGEVYAESLGDKLSQSRFNCTQCHVPQAKIDPWVQNNFEQVFRDNNLKNSSNLAKSIDDGVK